MDPRNCNVGYVALIRGKPDDAMLKVESPEKDVFRCYRKNVLLPWITEIRRTVHNLSEGAPVPDELSAVSWLDGGMPQLAVVVTEEMQDADKLLKICTCKHAAAATGTQQPCDLCAAFRTMKIVEKLVLSEHRHVRSSKCSYNVSSKKIAAGCTFGPAHTARSSTSWPDSQESCRRLPRATSS